MAISFNTGTAVSSGGSNTTSFAMTIPAGVLANDVVLVVFSGFRGSAAETMQVSSTGTALTNIIATQSTTFSGNDCKSALWYFVASATDAGKVITVSFVSNDNATWAGACAAYTGALTSGPIDVSGSATSSGASSTITCPSEVTGVANDWDLQIVGAALGGSSFTGGGGFTQRESVSDASSGSTAFIYDSNASVGPAGTTIGGANFANAGHNSWWIGFTVGLAPAAGNPAGTVQPRATVPVPRRTRARGLFSSLIPVASNASGVAGSVPVLMVQRTEVISRVTGRVVRR